LFSLCLYLCLYGCFLCCCRFSVNKDLYIRRFLFVEMRPKSAHYFTGCSTACRTHGRSLVSINQCIVRAAAYYTRSHRLLAETDIRLAGRLSSIGVILGGTMRTRTPIPPLISATKVAMCPTRRDLCSKWRKAIIATSNT